MTITKYCGDCGMTCHNNDFKIIFTPEFLVKIHLWALRWKASFILVVGTGDVVMATTVFSDMSP